MQTIGAVLRSLRQDKGLTQAQLAHGIMSRSHLSELEHQNYYPTYDKFLRLVNRLGLSLDEFQRELTLQQENEADYYAHRSNDLVNQCDFIGLANFLKTEFTVEIAQRSLYLQHKRLTLLGELEFYQQAGQIDHAKYRLLFTYLLNTAHWHEYEIRLLTNSIFLAEYPLAKTLDNKMSKKIASHELYGREKNIPILFNNLAELALQNNDPHQAVIYCDLAQHFAHQMNDLYNQLLATINRSLAAAILTQQADSHLATNLTILQEFGYPQVYQHYQQLIQQLHVPQPKK